MIYHAIMNFSVGGLINRDFKNECGNEIFKQQNRQNTKLF